jgi:hypothetical protein
MISHFRFRVNFCGNLRYMIKLGVPKLMLYVDWFMCMLNGCGRPKKSNPLLSEIDTHHFWWFSDRKGNLRKQY